MLKKLLDGEFSLSETFWKFGILGVIFFRFVSKLFEILLDRQIANRRIVDYFFHYFNPVKPDILAILWTLCYVSTTIFFLYYCIAVILGTWRSSASFERSNLLKHLTRILMFVFVAVCMISVF